MGRLYGHHKGIQSLQQQNDPLSVSVSLLLYNRIRSFYDSNGVRITSFENKLADLIEKHVVMEEGEEKLPKMQEVEESIPQGEGKEPIVHKKKKYLFKSDEDEKAFEEHRQKLVDQEVMVTL